MREYWRRPTVKRVALEFKLSGIQTSPKRVDFVLMERDEILEIQAEYDEDAHEKSEHSLEVK